ncbi:MAG: hypothetical protein FWC23_09770 [Chitinispirillia bacterium]|nr:hypothetical protein [Chitinispirillia bacterium]MCL2269457.1 hypothetical protein [Chitinispirillia bacterium]
MIEGHYPFGITPEKIGEFYREHEGVKVNNHPVRNVDTETFWDFANAPAEESFFTPEALEALGK